MTEASARCCFVEAVAVGGRCFMRRRRPEASHGALIRSLLGVALGEGRTAVVQDLRPSPGVRQRCAVGASQRFLDRIPG